MALLIGEGQKVGTVYLYPNTIADFAAYKGTLPLGLSANDNMASVEDKFGQPKVEHQTIPIIGQCTNVLM